MKQILGVIKQPLTIPMAIAFIIIAIVLLITVGVIVWAMGWVFLIGLALFMIGVSAWFNNRFKANKIILAFIILGLLLIFASHYNVLEVGYIDLS